MVITRKINENEMGNCGSKSIKLGLTQQNLLLKEQRVEGNNYQLKLGFIGVPCLNNNLFLYKDRSLRNLESKLRFSLMDCESSYRISNPSKQKLSQAFKHQQTRKFNTFSYCNSSSSNLSVKNDKLLLDKRLTNLIKIDKLDP